MARIKSCPYCGRVHAADYDCGQKPKRQKESTELTKLRSCRRWNNVRKLVNERDHYLCRVCLAQKRLTHDKLETHHIVPLCEDVDLAYDPNNLITLCAKHHKAADSGQISRNMLQDLTRSPC